MCAYGEQGFHYIMYMKSLFALTYGMKAFILEKLWIPTFQMENFDPATNNLFMNLELDLLNGKKDQAVKFYNKNV